MLSAKCVGQALRESRTAKRSVAVSFVVSCAVTSLGHASVLYTSTGSTPTSYYTFSGNDPSDTYAAGSGNGNGDDYNVGNVSFTLTGLSFYGGDTDPNQPSNPNYVSPVPGAPNASQYGVSLEFYNLAGNRVATIGLPLSKVYGIGLHTLVASDLQYGGGSPTLSGAGYFTFEPYYLTYANGGTGEVTPPPAGRAQFTFGFAGAPTIGVNNPTYSAQTNAAVPAFPQTFVTTGSYGAGGDPTLQYGDFELDGTPATSNSTNPIWTATGSGTWENTANWTKGVPNSTSLLTSANFVAGVTSNTTVTLTANHSAANVNFDNATFNYSLTGSSTLTLSSVVPSNDNIGGANHPTAGTAVPATISSWAGSNTISCPIVFTAGLNVTAFADPSPSTPSLTLPLNVSATGTLTKIGVGTLAFAASSSGVTTLSLPAINISSGTIVLQSNPAHPNRTLLITASLSVSTIGKLDLGSNDLDDAGDTLANIEPLVVMGYAGGAWTGPGIASSTAASNAPHLTALGVIQNNQNGTPLFTAAHQFDGTTPGVSDVLAKYTYFGDANLDGKVDGSDYSLIDSSFISQTATGWLNGDFNYDGVVNGSDYTLIDNAFNTQGAALTAELATPTAEIAEVGGTSAVPEPTSLGVCVVGSAGLLRRRRQSIR